jgi:hypothetical protein
MVPYRAGVALSVLALKGLLVSTVLEAHILLGRQAGGR